MMDVKGFGTTADDSPRIHVRVRQKSRFLFTIKGPREMSILHSPGSTALTLEIGLERARYLRDQLDRAIEYADTPPTRATQPKERTE